MTDTTRHQSIRAPRGKTISCKGWQQEAALRMLLNSLDPEVAENSEKLVAGGGGRKIARDWASFHAIVASLQSLEGDETLLVQSGEPGGVVHTYPGAPRVVLLNSAGDLNIDGQPLLRHESIDSWMYTGAQEILYGAYQSFAEAALKYFQGDLAGKLILGVGMGRESGSQSLAATLNGAAFLGIDADPENIKRRVKSGYCDVMVNDLDEALRILKNAVRKHEAASVGLVANFADVIPELARRGVVPDFLAGPGSTHDLAGNYIPQGLDAAQAAELRQSDAGVYRQRAQESMANQVEGILALQKLGSIHIHPRSGEIFGDAAQPIRWAALSGEPSDIHRTGKLILEMFPRDEILCRWIALAQKRVRFQGLPGRIALVGRNSAGNIERAEFGLAVNDLVERGELKAPIVIAADRQGLATNSLPNDPLVETPALETLLEAANGASWVTINLGTDTQQIGQAVVADGTKEMSERIARVFAPASANLTPKEMPAKKLRS